MSVEAERSSTESSAASGLDFEDAALALTLRLPGSDPGRSSPLAAAPSDAAPSSPKARVVGWPPVRSYRKNALADSSKASRAAKFVKVAVDGAPYLRKVDLQAYAGYDQLLRALQDKFFSHFTISQEVRRRRGEAGGRGERDGVRAHVRGQGWRLDARRRCPLEDVCGNLPAPSPDERFRGRQLGTKSRPMRHAPPPLVLEGTRELCCFEDLHVT